MLRKQRRSLSTAAPLQKCKRYKSVFVFSTFRLVDSLTCRLVDPSFDGEPDGVAVVLGFGNPLLQAAEPEA